MRMLIKTQMQTGCCIFRLRRDITGYGRKQEMQGESVADGLPQAAESGLMRKDLGPHPRAPYCHIQSHTVHTGYILSQWPRSKAQTSNLGVKKVAGREGSCSTCPLSRIWVRIRS